MTCDTTDQQVWTWNIGSIETIIHNKVSRDTDKVILLGKFTMHS